MNDRQTSDAPQEKKPKTEREQFTQASERAASEFAEGSSRAQDAAVRVSDKAMRAGVEMLQHNAESVQRTFAYGAKFASDMTERSAAQFGSVFGFSGGSGEGGEKARQTTWRNMETLVQSSMMLTEIMPRLIEEWADIGRARMSRGFERMGALSQCRTPQDVVAFQSEVLCDNIETVLSCVRKGAEAATRLADEAKRVGSLAQTREAA